MLSSRISRVVLLVRGPEGLAKAVNFYHQAVGLPVVRVTDEWAELTAGNSLRLHLQAVQTESQLSTGYSPIIHFDIPNMDQAVAACVQNGAHLDGPIQFPAHGKVASMRTPDGHMIGLYEPATS